MISLILEHTGNIEQRVFSQSEVLIGRGGTDTKVDLDLSHDPTVSRLHLRVLERDKMLFVEDLGSTTGTFINDTPISTIQQIFESDTIQIGENIIRIRFDGGAASTKIYPPRSGGAQVASYYVYRNKQYKYTTDLGQNRDEANSEIEKEKNPIHVRIEESDEMAIDDLFSGEQDSSHISKSYLKMLLDAPRRFSKQTDLNHQLIEIVGRLVEEMDGVERSAILILEESSGYLDLRAHYPENEPAVSGTLAMRTLTEEKGFIWQRSSLDHASESIKTLNINSGIYAPIICGDQKIGVICVDTTRKNHIFKLSELHFFLAFTQVISACIQNSYIRETLKLNLNGIKEALQGEINREPSETMGTIDNYIDFLRKKILDD